MSTLRDIFGSIIASRATATRRELVQDLAVTYSGALTSADLRGVDLCGICFDFLRFDGAFFDGAHLSDAKFRGCIFRDVSMRQAYGDSTNFDFTTWANSDMEGARFWDASFIGANFGNTDFASVFMPNARHAGAPAPTEPPAPTANFNVTWAPPVQQRSCNTCTRNLAEGEQLTCKPCLRERRARRKAVRDNGRKFGVELEFILTDGEGYGEPLDARYIVQELADAGITCEDGGYTHNVLEDSWKVVTDASVEGGWEINSPPLLWAQRAQVNTVCEVLENMGAEIDEQCGLHVHHDIGDLPITSVKRAVNRWAQVQHLTDLMTHRSRRNGYWCKHVNAHTLQQVRDLKVISQLANAPNDRLLSLNLQCHSAYGTMEVRQHEGTLDADKILAWAAYGQAVIHGAHKRTPVPTTEGLSAYLDALPFQGRDSEREALKRAAENYTFGGGGRA